MNSPVECREGVWGGIPVFRGTRIPVYLLLDIIETDSPLEEFWENWDIPKHLVADFLRLPLPMSEKF